MRCPYGRNARGSTRALRVCGSLCAALLALSPSIRADVALSEVLYHDADPTQDLEFVEIHNTGTAPVVLTGWTIRGGIEFAFPEGAVIAPDGYGVIAHDAEDLAAYHGIDVLGEYSGRLNNGGDVLELRDDRGRLASRIEYDDQWPWPVLADGGGPSLERIDYRPTSGSDPAAWAAADNAGDWRLVERVGHATTTTHVFWLEASGECLIDDVRITPIDSPTANLVRNGTFDADAATWTFTGTHGKSVWEAAEGRAAPGCLRIVATGAGSESVCARFSLSSNPTPWGLYRVSYYVKWVKGGRELHSRFTGGGTPADVSLLGFGTPGRANSRTLAVRPPVVLARTLQPAQPVAGEAITITARVASESPPSEVLLTYRVNFAAAQAPIPMTPEGGGSWSAAIPAQSANALVRYTLTVKTAEGELAFPPPEEPTDYFAFLVHAADENVSMPLVFLFIAPTDLVRLNVNPSANTYVPATIVINGDAYENVRIRYRGGSVRNHPKKFYKLKFNRGRRWEGQKTINLNAEYPDYSRIRTHIAHTLFGEAGVLASMTDFYRLSLNGAYQGVYVYVEDPEEPYLARQGRDEGGNLYKCYTKDEMRNTLSEFYSYTIYRKETSQETDRDDLIQFITSMNQLPQSQLQAYVEDHVDVERVLAYVAMNAVLSNGDWGHKNHYLFHDLKTDRWEFGTWDVDLVMGKDWNPDCTGVGGAPCGGVFCHQGFYTQGIVGSGAYNRLTSKVLSIPKYSTRYEEILIGLLGSLFRSEEMVPWIDSLYSYLSPSVIEEITKWRTYWCQMTEAQYAGQEDALKRWVPLRTNYILSQIVIPDSNVQCAERPGNVVEVTWQAAAGHVRDRVYVDGKLVGNIPGTDGRFVTAPLRRGTHEVCVAGVNAAGRQSVQRCCSVTLAGIAPPSKLVAAVTAVEGRPALRVAWENADAYTAVNLYLDRGAGYVLAATAGAGAVEATFELGDAAGLAQVVVGAEGVLDDVKSAVADLIVPLQVPAVDAILCSWNAGTREVQVFYQGGEVPGGAYDTIEVLANGAKHAEFNPAQSPQFFTFTADASLVGTVTFALRGVWRGIGSAPGATCEIDVGGGEARFTRGDVTGDGQENLSDAVRILRHLFAAMPLACTDAADVNDDGRLNVADAAALLGYLFAGGDPPPAPFPNEGVDPTADELGCR